MKRWEPMSHGTVREGVIAGAVGATGVAVWLFITDVLASQPLYTPRVLGQGVARLVGLGVPSAMTAIVGYTILHYVVFAFLGFLSTAIVHRSRKDPTIFAGALLVFAVLEAAFALFMLALHAVELFGRYGMLQIAGANIFGWVLIGVVLWRAHPGIRRSIDKGLSGA